MDRNRNLIEVLKFAHPKDVLSSTSIVSCQWLKVSDLAELWTSFCELSIVFPSGTDPHCHPKQTFKDSMSNSHPFLVVWSASRLLLYNCAEERECSSVSVHIERTCAATMLGRNKVFICGGDDKMHACKVIEFRTSQVINYPPMQFPRRYHGAACIGVFVYVFGGDKSGSTAEKCHLKNKCWTNLPQMPCSRSAFTPCVFQSLIYLCGGNTSLCHSFDIVSETYQTLLLATHSSWCVTSIVQNELVLEAGPARIFWNRETGELARKELGRNLVP